MFARVVFEEARQCFDRGPEHQRAPKQWFLDSCQIHMDGLATGFVQINVMQVLLLPVALHDRRICARNSCYAEVVLS
jgi:hypothetical protein